MTSAASLSEFDPEPDDDHELSRITVLVGSVLIDVGVPSSVNVSAFVNDVIELANEQLAARIDPNAEFDNVEGKWTFARLAGGTINPDQSLADAGVYDGELLVVREAGVRGSSVLVDDLEGAAESVGGHRQWLTEHRLTAMCFMLSISLAAAAALLAPELRIAAPVARGLPIGAIAMLMIGVGCAAAACVMPYRPGDPPTAAWLAGVALPLIFGGSLYVVPEVHGVEALPIALALTALIALLQLLITGQGRSLYTTVIVLALLGVPAAVLNLELKPNPRAVGAILATAAVIVVNLAPRVTILLSGLPVPRVPTAGEPLDDVETQGGMAVEGVNAIGKQIIPTEEGMGDRVWRATEYLTGMVAGAAMAAVVGCGLAIDMSDGFHWERATFAIAVATVLCLRGRSHHHLVQSAVLIAGGLIIALAVIVRTATFVDGWQVQAAVALVALTLLLVLCGLVAPSLEFSPVMRRRVEIVEYVAIALVFPLACWIIGLYGYFRELRI
jgi:type VII secretion integral membrane protein EccD